MQIFLKNENSSENDLRSWSQQFSVVKVFFAQQKVKLHKENGNIYINTTDFISQQLSQTTMPGSAGENGKGTTHTIHFNGNNIASNIVKGQNTTIEKTNDDGSVSRKITTNLKTTIEINWNYFETEASIQAMMAMERAMIKATSDAANKYKPTKHPLSRFGKFKPEDKTVAVTKLLAYTECITHNKLLDSNEVIQPEDENALNHNTLQKTLNDALEPHRDMLDYYDGETLLQKYITKIKSEVTVAEKVVAASPTLSHRSEDPL